MNCRRHHAHCRISRLLRQIRHVGVTLQTNLADFGPNQHPRIRRPMRFMAGSASVEFHRRMFEREWSAFIAVALQAPWLISGKSPGERGPNGSVRVVAIHTGHGILRNFVAVWLIEHCLHIQVAAFAERIHIGGFPRNQAIRPVGMNLMTSGARDRISRVGILNPARVGRLIQVAIQANPVCFPCRQLRRVPDQ